jgi:hypothetical protein
LKQAGRAWWQTVSSFLQKLKFKECKSDRCLFIRRTEKKFAILALYVDDIVLAASSESELTTVKRLLSQEYKMKDMGLLTYALGVKVDQDLEAGTTVLSLGAYIQAMLKRFNMQDCKPAPTPLTVEKICRDVGPITSGTIKYPYRECVGALMFAACAARPDIATAVGRCARHVETPTADDIAAVKRVLRYLQGTRSHGIRFSKAAPEAAQPTLIAFADADWANSSDRKSTSGCLIQYGGAVLWGSRRQKCVALSSTEAEFIAASHAVQQVMWLRQLLRDLGIPQHSPTTMFEDNQSCIKMVENESLSQRSKHIDIKYRFIQDEQKKGTVALRYIPSEDNLADMFTKPLSSTRFVSLRDQFMSPSRTGEEGVGNAGAALNKSGDMLAGAATLALHYI